MFVLRLFAAVQSLNSLNDQIASFMVTSPKPMEQEQEEEPITPPEKETMHKSMTLMRHLLVDAQVRHGLKGKTRGYSLLCFEYSH